MKYNETRIEQLFAAADESFGKIKIEQLGRGCFIEKEPEQTDIDMAREALARCNTIMKEGKFDVVILDELCIALHFHLLTEEEVISALHERAENVEVVITGRKAPQSLIDLADLVTDMQEVKHYYTQGVLSRDGIDH